MANPFASSSISRHLCDDLVGREILLAKTIGTDGVPNGDAITALASAYAEPDYAAELTYDLLKHAQALLEGGIGRSGIVDSFRTLLGWPETTADEQGLGAGTDQDARSYFNQVYGTASNLRILSRKARWPWAEAFQVVHEVSTQLLILTVFRTGFLSDRRVKKMRNVISRRYQYVVPGSTFVLPLDYTSHGHVMIARQFIPGPTLGVVAMVRNGTLESIARLLLKCAEIMQSNRLSHGYLTPGRIQVSEFTNVFIADHLIGDYIAGALCDWDGGSPDDRSDIDASLFYIDPDRRNGRHSDPALRDIYSFGACIYSCLWGNRYDVSWDVLKRPYEPFDFNHPFQSSNVSLLEGLTKISRRAMRLDSERSYSSFLGVIEDLRSLVDAHQG